MDYICQQFGHLKLVKSVPSEIQQDDRIRLANRAMDVRSACIFYLAVQLKHDKAWLGIVGNILMTDLAHKCHRESGENICRGRWKDHGCFRLFRKGCE